MFDKYFVINCELKFRIYKYFVALVVASIPIRAITNTYYNNKFGSRYVNLIILR